MTEIHHEHFSLIAIVAIVAIVALVVLVINIKVTQSPQQYVVGEEFITGGAYTSRPVAWEDLYGSSDGGGCACVEREEGVCVACKGSCSDYPGKKCDLRGSGCACV